MKLTSSSRYCGKWATVDKYTKEQTVLAWTQCDTWTAIKSAYKIQEEWTSKKRQHHTGM